MTVTHVQVWSPADPYTTILDTTAAPTEELYLVCVAKPLLGHHCLPEKGPDHLCIALGARGLVGDLSITILHRALPK